MLTKITEMFKQHKKYAKNASLYMLVTIITSVIYIAINPLMSLFMSPDDYAIVGYYTSFYLLLTPILSFSLVTYYARNYVKLDAAQRDILADTLLRTLLFISIILLPIVAGGFLVYFHLTEVTLPIFPFFILVLLSRYFNTFSMMLQTRFRMEQQARKFFNLTLVAALISVVLSIIFVTIFKWGAFGFLLAPLLAEMAMAVYSYKKLYTGTPFNRTALEDSLKFCWPITVSASLWYFISGVDRAMLEPLDDINNLALYNVAISVVGRLTMIYQALLMTFQPDIFTAAHQNNRRKILLILGVIFALNCIPNILFMILAKPAMYILTADRYTASYVFVGVMALGNISASIYFCTAQVIVAYGLTKTDMMVKIAGAVVSVMMFKWLISDYQFMGAAWGRVVIYILLTIITLMFVSIYKIYKKRVI